MPLLPPRRRAVSTSLVASLASLAALACATAVLAPAARGAETPDGTPGRVGADRGGFARYAAPAEPGDRRAAARVLADARGLADGDPVDRPAEAAEGRAATVVLRDLALAQEALTPADQVVAQRILARPTASGGDGYIDYADTARVTSDCAVRPVRASRFCVHWARRTSDAPPLADSDRDGVPNQVETTRKVLDQSWSRLVTQGGYPAPPGDGRGPKGYRNRLDVYLGDTGADGIYGYCIPEFAVSAQRASSYCGLDDDFATTQFPGSPGGNLRVTAVHEFFHAVQFGIDYREDGFFMENSSTWVEDEVFDAVDDNRHYFGDSALQRPADPLDLEDDWYGNWIWLRFLTETFPAEGGTGLPTLVRDAWTRADDTRTTYSLQALDGALAARGGDLDELMADFATTNRSPGSFYEEGAAYPQAPLLRSHTVSTSASSSATVDHLAAATVAAVPASGLAPGSQVRVDVDAPSLPDELQVNVVSVAADGTRTTSDLMLAGSGNGTLTLPFAPGAVGAVELTMANGGRDYTCWVGGFFACSGTPLDDDRVFSYRFTAVPAAGSRTSG